MENGNFATQLFSSLNEKKAFFLSYEYKSSLGLVLKSTLLNLLVKNLVLKDALGI